jgi:hypothetical protein
MKTPKNRYQNEQTAKAIDRHKPYDSSGISEASSQTKGNLPEKEGS